MSESGRPVEDDFGALADVAAAVCQTPVALVALVDGDRVLFEARVGTDVTDQPRASSPSDHVVSTGALLVVEDLDADGRFGDGGVPGARFYAGAPVFGTDGVALGAVCVVDHAPRTLTTTQERVLVALAGQAARLLELRRLAVVMDELAQARDRTHRALEETRALLIHQALHDPLTALPNRRLLLDRIEHALAAVGRRGGMVAVCFIDLDGFKAVNDRLGHHAGDRLLVELAHRLKAVVRASDTLARVGGDEFVVVATEVASADTATALARRLVDAAGSAVDLDGEEVRLSGSVGVALAASGEESAVALIDRADAAMYRAKRSGGATIELA